jgi:hypothetical protein
MKRTTILVLIAILVLPFGAGAQPEIDGFLQGLYGGQLETDNPTATQHTASETRLQLRLSHFGEASEFFGRIDFTFDGADSINYDWELREAYGKFQLGGSIDVKAGRQIITWGTGDLVFINDVFAKDYRSFFIGRDDQYLKAPQNSLRVEYYIPIGDLSLIWSPRFEPNRLPTGRRLSYFNPFVNDIVGEGYFFDPPVPGPELKNGELAARFSRGLGDFRTSLYFYKGFYKNPLGAEMIESTPVPVYPHLHVYGASVRGPLAGGILWLEGGYFDSRDDRNGNDPMKPNSSLTGLIGFERQVATNLIVNGQWQFDYVIDHDLYRHGQRMAGSYVRDQVKHLLTMRITKLLKTELLKLSSFVFYSPSEEDIYLRLLTEYKYTDEITLAAGANLFDGKNPATEFGQFRKNDNIYGKLTYGF